MPCHLSGKADKRNTVIIGSGKPCHQVGSARAAGHQTDPHFSCCPRIRICLMHQSLFVPWQDHIDLTLLIELITDINGTCTPDIRTILPLPLLLTLLPAICFLKSASILTPSLCKTPQALKSSGRINSSYYEFQRLSLLKFVLIIRCIFIFVNSLFLMFFNIILLSISSYRFLPFFTAPIPL